jgi:beta-fructofuranosidase
MLITARLRGEGRGRGVVGHATSDDLDRWEVHPPLSEAGPFDHLEVVQTVTLDGSHLLVASCGDGELNPEHHGVGTPGGVYLLPGDGPVGPWSAARARRVAHPSLYAARLIDDHGTPALLGFRDIENGRFVGEIPDPVPIVLEDDTGVGTRSQLALESFEVNLG